MSVGLIYRDIEYNESSPFYSYLLKDTYFSNLRYFAYSTGGRNPDKLSLADHVSIKSVSLTKNNDVFQGLPIPPPLRRRAAQLNGSVRHWILCYHDMDEPALFVLFPSGPYAESESLVAAVRDLEDRKLPDTELQTPLHSFFADRLYVWPKTILIKDDQKIREGLVFDIPQLFLSRDDAVVKDYKQVSSKLDGKAARDLIETMSDADLAKNKYFNLFYDADGIVLYLRGRS